MSEAKPTSAAIAERIRDERHRLMLEQNLAVDLDAQRLAPLEAGDDAALDRVELQIQGCNDRQLRIQERIEILERRRAEAEASERDARLDALAARAEHARETGERLIAVDYVKHATALAAVLERLATTDAVIRAANIELEAAGRTPVNDSNAIRCRPQQYIQWVATETVGYNDQRHPSFGNVHFDQAGNPYDKTTKTPVAIASIQVERNDFVNGNYPAPLHRAVSLPSAEPEPLEHRSLPTAAVPPPIWSPTFEVSDDKVVALLSAPEQLSGPASALEQADDQVQQRVPRRVRGHE